MKEQTHLGCDGCRLTPIQLSYHWWAEIAWGSKREGIGEDMTMRRGEWDWKRDRELDIKRGKEEKERERKWDEDRREREMESSDSMDATWTDFENPGWVEVRGRKPLSILDKLVVVHVGQKCHSQLPQGLVHGGNSLACSQMTHSHTVAHVHLSYISQLIPNIFQRKTNRWNLNETSEHLKLVCGIVRSGSIFKTYYIHDLENFYPYFPWQHPL